MESALKEMPRSIAIKGYNSDSISAKKSKGNQNTFADFMRDLGKTTAPKNAKSTALNPSDKTTKTSTTGDLSAESTKTEILSNLLKGKNQEVKNEKTPQSPLDNILQRPKATHTKLNATPEIKQPEAPSDGRFSNRDAVMRSLKGTNISFADSADDKGFMKILENSTESAKNRAIPSVSDLQNEGQKMAQNNAKADFADLTPKDLSPKTPQSVANKKDLAPKSTPSVEVKSEKENPTKEIMAQKNFAQKGATPNENSTKAEIPTPKENNSKTPNTTNQHTNIDETNQSANITESSVESALDATQGDEIPRNMTNEKTINASVTPSAPNVAQESQIKVSDSKQTPQSSQLSQTPQEAQNTQNAKDSTAQNFAKLGIANTLKYGAFKAFDALSLLKPSDGKKLSELIKKADELSLNLQSVKYTKMAQTPLSQNYFANQLAESAPKITEPNLAPNLAQNMSANQIAPKEVPSQVAQDSALAKVLNESPKEMPKAPSEAIPSNEAQIPKNDKSADVNSPKDSKNLAQNDKNIPQSAESKAAESKIAESKIPDSKMESKAQESKIEQPKAPEQSPKSATNTQNSDVKPISLKENAIPNKGDSGANQSANQSESSQNIAHTEQNQTAQNHKTELGSKLFDARETMRHFAHNLRSEIQNYKPPLTKITLELQPANLGSVEVSIISQGKNIQIQLNASQNTLNLFIQNQSDLRTALSQIGYDNVAMSFSNGSQMGFSDNSGKWRYESNANKFRNNFGLKSVDDAQDENEVFEIMITNNYA